MPYVSPSLALCIMFMEFIKTVFLVTALGLMSNWLVQFMLYLDLNKRVYNHVPGSCSNVAGIENGAEDMALLSNGLILVTTGLKFYNTSELKEAKGSVFVYNSTGKSAWEVKLESKTLVKPKTFNPHGISVFEDKGRTLVFIANHRQKADTVEVFRYKDTERDKLLVHLRTVKSPLFTNLNDVVAVSKDKFYVTNYHYFEDERMQSAELYLGLRLGSVVFFDGKNSSFVEQWIRTPNGLALDKSKKYLYVSSLAGEKILVYAIEKDWNLTYHSEIPLGTSPDNIFVDPYTADLYVGCHPVKSRLFRHESAPKSIFSPSQVLKIRGRPAKGKWSISQVYANDGATLSGSSSAVKYKGTLMIGSVHDKLLSCELDAPQLL